MDGSSDARRRSETPDARRILCVGSIPLSTLVNLDPKCRILRLPDLESALRLLAKDERAHLIVDLAEVVRSQGISSRSGDPSRSGSRDRPRRTTAA